MPPEILTSDELALRLKANPETIRRLTRSGKLPVMRLGGEYRYDWAAVSAALECPARLPDHLLSKLVNDLRDCATEFAGTQQLRERLAAVVRAALGGSAGV